MKARSRRALALIFACWLASPGLAAPTAPPAAAKPKPSASPTPTPVETSPPYETQLLRLGEIMGALSFLRDLCGANDGGEFRDRFAKLIEAEAGSTERKETLAGAFNRGFDDYQTIYRVCTDSARESITHYLDETEKIARDVATRYGG